MADDDLMEALTRRRPTPPRQAASEPKSDLTLPDLSRPYEAFARPASQPLFSLHCLLGKEGCRAFQYAGMDSNSSFGVDAGGQVIQLRFCGSNVTAVTIHGRNLSTLWDYLHQHRVAYVRQVDDGRDFGNDKATVITAIDIEEIKETEAGQSP